MSPANLNQVVRLLSTAAEQTESQRSDRQLLLEYLNEKDEAAFATLVRRHSRRVLSACRQVLADPTDVDDAFQATFLVLFRKARSVHWQASLGAWLHAVAHRVAVHARKAAYRRQLREARAASPEPEVASPDLSWREAVGMLHEELDRLPDSYRLPLLLCYLEGRSRDEAAQQLGWSLGMVRGRLERGRERLRRRLLQRGITLSVGLFTATAEPSWAAALSDALLQATVAVHAQSVPAAVAALASAVTPATVPASRQLLCFLGVSCLIAVGLGLVPGTQPTAADLPPPNAASSANAETSANNAADNTGPGFWLGGFNLSHLFGPPTQPTRTPDRYAYFGRVVGPDGKPIAGATIYMLQYTPRPTPIRQWAKSADDGRFRFEVKATEFASTPSREGLPASGNGFLLATAPGFGVGWTSWMRPDLEQPIQLTVDDTPVAGRILDLQGRPVAGAVVRVRWLHRPNGPDLTAWYTALTQSKESNRVNFNHLDATAPYWLFHGDLCDVLPAVQTGLDGRFQLTGLGKERVAKVRIEGDTIEASDVYVMTRKATTVVVEREAGWKEVPKETYHGANFEHAAAPSRPVVGVVRDAASGRPVAGVHVLVQHIPDYHVHNPTRCYARTDADGRYRLTGLPLRAGNVLRFEPPGDEPHLIAAAKVPHPPGLDPVSVDVRLQRGVWVAGRVFNRQSNEAVVAELRYYVPADNPHLKQASDFHPAEEMTSRASDGGFRFVGLPGKGYVALGLREMDPEKAFVVDAGRKRLPASISAKPFDLNPLEHHTVRVVDIPAGARETTCDIALDPGRSVTIGLVGPDGQPVQGGITAGSNPWNVLNWKNQPGSSFQAFGLSPGQPRFVQAVHQQKRLAGSLKLGGDEPGPLTLQLQPWGTVVGRVVEEDGTPRANLTLDFYHGVRAAADVNSALGFWFRGGGAVQTNQEGAFRVEGLVPGMRYTLGHARGGRIQGYVFKNLAAKSGETDLGEVKSSFK